MKTHSILLLFIAFISLPLLGQESNEIGLPKPANFKTVKTGEPIQASPFEFSGQVTATVYLDGFHYENEGYCLYSVVNDEIRGTSRGMYFSPTGQWLHTHMIYSNKDSGETVSFRLYDERSGNWYEFEESLVFQSDMIEANAFEPLILKTSHLLEPCALSLEPSLEVFPNPTGSHATIVCSISKKQPVIIQVMDITARIMEELDFGLQEEGKHNYQWDTSQITEGTYILRFKNEPGIIKQVIIKH